jgi:3-dehydroquinate synthase
MPDNLILIGFMGAGKDLVGRALARKTGRTCLSLDRLIELKTGEKIADLFHHRGEPHFRRIEKAVLRSVRDLKNIILATGGGVVLDGTNRKILKGMGLVVHLRVDLPTAEQRLKNDRTRPLIRDKKRIRKIFDDRRGLYDFDDWSVDTVDQSPEEVADLIIEKAGMTKYSFTPAEKIIEMRFSERTRPVVVAGGIFSRPSIMKPFCRFLRRGIIVTNPVVGALYLDQAVAAFRDLDIELLPFILPDGECRKNLGAVRRLYDHLSTKGFTRSDCLVSLGGGVITDLTGFAAATYKRGMKLIHIPTTLLAQVDAAIGGKCGVNLAEGKNLIGAFYQPDLVACDPVMLLSLPDAEFHNGLAEVVKYGFIGCTPLFTRLEADPGAVMNRDIDLLAGLVGSCVELKRRVVEQDEREEKGRREILNFGHTIGHALEARNGYRKYRHGAAVAIGMVQEARWAAKKGALSKRDSERLRKLLVRFGLPTVWPSGISRSTLRRHVRQDKKIRDGKLRVPVPVRIGKVMIKEVAWESFL